MRDVTKRRQRYDALRAELLAVWAQPNLNEKELARVTGELRALLSEEAARYDGRVRSKPQPANL
jgi:hypothetical protein